MTTSFSDLHAPAGLHIGAIGPEEIAMAVMCEILAHHRQFVVQGKEISV